MLKQTLPYFFLSFLLSSMDYASATAIPSSPATPKAASTSTQQGEEKKLSPDAKIGMSIISAIRKEIKMGGSTISISVVSGKVSLRGTVISEEQKAFLIKLVKRLPGCKEATFNITIKNKK